jgi:hypothetical protein
VVVSTGSHNSMHRRMSARDDEQIGSHLSISRRLILPIADAPAPSGTPPWPRRGYRPRRRSYQLTKYVEAFGLVNNLFSRHYYAAGTFFDTGGFNSNTFGAPNFFILQDPRTFLPGMPLRPTRAFGRSFSPGQACWSRWSTARERFRPGINGGGLGLG